MKTTGKVIYESKIKSLFFLLNVLKDNCLKI